MAGALGGRTAVVTGAGRGIGAAIARALDAAGARVVLIARTVAQLEQTAATLTNDPAVIVADLSTQEGPAMAATETLDILGGRVDVLVNNAAVALRKPSDELTADEIDWMLHTNVRSALLLTGAILPSMAAARAGSIVSISSISGRRGTPRRAAYAATKSAIDGMTRAWAMEYGPLGIRANAVAPGVVHTDMWTENLAIPGVEETVTGVIPTRRLTDPAEVASVVVFLASDASSAITGETLSADGGMHATVNLYPTV
jgi:gluconate 5-dehydrogenase/3-oxoacyl-[acyl-carrier protein] reductase